MIEDSAPHGPFTIEVKIHLTDGENEAEVSFDCPAGNCPKEDDLGIFAEKAIAAVQEQMGESWRLQNRQEFMQSRLQEKAGVNINFAVPHGEFAFGWAQ